MSTRKAVSGLRFTYDNVTAEHGTCCSICVDPMTRAVRVQKEGGARAFLFCVPCARNFGVAAEEEPVAHVAPSAVRSVTDGAELSKGGA